MAAVALENICKSYDGTKVVHSLNLEIPDKEFTVFVGPSGCGKSTTLRMIAGLETITDGSILIGERVVNDMPPRMRNIAMVFQDYALYPHMTVAKNLGFGLKITGLPQAEIKQRVGQAAETLGITELLDRKPGQLSGGQRQRVAMGRAIVREPDVYLFDEPLSNLDAKLRAQMRIEVKKLHQRVGNTIIYVTHDQVEAMTLADRIVIMRDGIIEQVGKPRDIFENPANTFVATFIGSPPMNLIEAQLDAAAGELRLADDHSLPLPDRMRAVKELPQQLTVGIRPADMTPVGHGLAHDSLVAKITLEVELGEDLGTETIVLSSLGGQPINAVMYNPVPLVTGKPMTFEVAVDKLHLFDRATGLNVLTQ